MRRCLFCWDVSDASKKECKNCGKLFIEEASEQEKMLAIQKINRLREAKDEREK